MLLDQRDEDLMGELTGLAERRVGPDRDALFGKGSAELDFCGAQRGALRVVAEQRAGDAEQIVLQIELVGARRLRRCSFPFRIWHISALYAQHKRAIVGTVGKRITDPWALLGPARLCREHRMELSAIVRPGVAPPVALKAASAFSASRRSDDWSRGRARS